MTARITTLLFFLMFTSASAMAALVLPDTGKVELDPHREILLDPSNDFNPSINRQAQFSAAGDTQRLGYVKGAAWMRFTITRPPHAPAVWWLELQSPLLDHATLYFPQTDGSYRMLSAGDHEPLASREIQYRNPVFKLNFPPNDPITFFVRIEGRNTMSFSTVLWTPESFLENVQLEKLFFGFFLSLILLTMLSSYWLLKATRDANYRLLLAYTTLTLISTLCLQGYGYQYVWPDQPAINESLLIVSWMLLPLALVSFNLSFVGALRAPRMWGVSLLLAWTAAFAVVSIALSLTIAPAWVRLANSIWNPLVTAILSVLLGLFALRGNENARILFIAMLLLTASVAARTFRNIGLLDAGVLTDHAYQAGMIGHLLMVQYAISRHYRTLRTETQRARDELLKLTQASEKELNIRVQAQTKALSDTLHQLENAMAKQQLSRKRQQMFVDTLSHELKTPLTIIDLSAQNLAMNRQLSDDEKMAKYQKIMDATGRIMKVMEQRFDLELLARPPSEAATLEVSPKALIQQAVSASSIFANHHTIKIDSDDLPETFTCDPEALNLALRCLLDNALKYSPTGSTVTLRGHRLGNRKEDGICLEVIDEGPGISSEDLQQLFTPYFRSDATRHIPGTGLGLANAKRLVAAKGGELTVESTPGKGSCFRITLRP